MKRLLEYIQRLVNEEIKQYPKGYYHDRQIRIPFEDYGNGHSYIDHYIDWLKAVSKKGTLPKPTVGFEEEVYKGIEKFHDNKHANRDKEFRNYMSKEQLKDYMEYRSTLFNDVRFDNNGNLYVERQIGVKIDDIHQESPTLFNDLTKSYNNTVGGCWAYRKGRGQAYCSNDANFFITFKGYMFLDDIYWDELIRLETRENGEVEVRTYPNGRVQLEEIDLYDEENNTKVTLTAKDFDGPRIINSTFLGNNTTFKGNYAKLGYENIGYENQFIDRDGNEYKDREAIFSKALKDGKKIEDIVDAITDVGDGLRRVEFCGKYNLIDEEGNLLSANQWFDGCYDFKDGFAKVIINHKYNFIDRQANIVSPNQWFDDCWDFNDGLAMIMLNKKWNWIDKEGNILFPNQWFDGSMDFEDGLAPIELDDKWNWIDKQGNILFPDQSFDWCSNFKNGFAKIELNEKWNWFDKQGNILFPNQWFSRVGYFNDGFAPIKSNNKWNWIDTQGNILFPNQSFDYCGEFRDGFALIKSNKKWNWIDKQGNNLFPNQWFDDCYDFRDGFAPIKLNGKWNFINKQGNLVSPNQWFSWCMEFINGFARVDLNGKHYFIDTKGNYYDVDTKQPIPNPTQKNESVRRKTNQTLMEARFRNYLNELVKEMMVN